MTYGLSLLSRALVARLTFLFACFARTRIVAEVCADGATDGDCGAFAADQSTTGRLDTPSKEQREDASDQEGGDDKLHD